jgi:hypothetical protein
MARPSGLACWLFEGAHADYSAVPIYSPIPGGASSGLRIYFVCGLHLLSRWMIGEYLAKNYLEAEKRSMFFIEKTA